MKKYILGAVLSLGIIISPAFTHAAGLTTEQANSLIAVVQAGGPSVPASAYANLITAFSNITTVQANSLIVVVQAGGPSVPASAYVNLLISFTGGTPTTTTPSTATFTASPTSGSAPLMVTFKSSTMGYAVNFGDNSSGPMHDICSTGSACGSSLPHTYTSPGTYIAKLTRTSVCNPPPGTSCTQEIVGTATITVTNGSTSGITVTAPNGGEQWDEGVLNTVTWTPYNYNPDINPARDVTAYLEKKNVDGSFITVGKVEESGKASIHWITGELNSATQGGNMASTGYGYYIRVVNNVTGAWDRSDAPFTLLPKPVDLKVNSSDGSVTIRDISEIITVSWSSRSDVSGCQLSGLQEQSFSTVQPSSGSYTGHISGDVAIMQCTIRNAQGVLTQVSDFVLVKVLGSPTIDTTLKITSPNGSESIPLNQNYTIRWSQKGLTNSIAIALYKNDTWQSWINKNVISDKSADDNYSYVWTAPSEASLNNNAYKIYITGQKADGTGYVDDKSDAPFGFVALATIADVYKGYLGGSLTPFITTNNISRADALANCMTNHTNNPSSSIRCTWGTEEVYSFTPAPVTCSKGDVDGNGTISSADQEQVLKYVTGLVSLIITDADKSRADVDGNGLVNLSDAISIGKYVVGLITTFPACATGTVGLPIAVVTSGLNQTASAINAYNSAANAGVSQNTDNLHYVWNRDLQVGSPYFADVTALQRALVRESVYAGEVTGGFYSQTYSAVQAFQRKYGINATGFVGSITRTKLNELY